MSRWPSLKTMPGTKPPPPISTFLNQYVSGGAACAGPGPTPMAPPMIAAVAEVSTVRRRSLAAASNRLLSSVMNTPWCRSGEWSGPLPQHD